MKYFTLFFLLLLPTQTFAMGDETMFHSGTMDVDYGKSEGQNMVTWDGSLWWGGDYNKLVLQALGEQTDKVVEHNEVQLLFSRYIDHFWDVRFGIRHNEKPINRDELALAFNGLAPYAIDTNIAFYTNTQGDIHGEIELAHDIQLTQNIIAELYLNSEWSAFHDDAQQIGSGLNQYDVGTQIRYEFNHHLAAYLDVYSIQSVGHTKTMLHLAGEKSSQQGFRLGIRYFNF